MTSTIAGPRDALNPTLEKAAATVAILAQEFNANDKYYLSPTYQEAEVRDDFIDKFLFALGWDVTHTIQKNPFQQEVKVERNVQMATAQRRADYALSLDPQVFQHAGRIGNIVHQRDEKNSAAFNFYLAKTYADLKDVDYTLLYLRKAW